MGWETNADTPFDRLFIKTSGVANTELVVDILLRERWLGEWCGYRLKLAMTDVGVWC
ncbi:hypothetical protein JCM14076_03090 [Methylosoma difficile]